MGAWLITANGGNPYTPLPNHSIHPFFKDHTNMSAAKKVIKKTPAINRQTENITSFATKTAASITEALTRSGHFNHPDGKVNVHIHVGDIILIGFDEAIDAEEWGMRENNTEIIGGKAPGAGARRNNKAEADPNKNKKISRTVNFKKGELQLNATEHSEPAKKPMASKRPARKKTTQTSRRA